MKKSLLALLLILAMALSLTACGNPASDVTQSPDPAVSPAIKADLSQDILAFSAGLSADDVLLTVNGEAVSADLFLYWLTYNCSYFESYAYLYGGTLSDSAEALLEDTVTMSTYYTLLRQKAVEYGCPPTDDQLAQAQEAMLADGQENYDLLKSQYGLSDASMEYIFTIDSYYSNLRDALIPAPTQDDLNNYVYHVKHILLATVDLESGSNTPLDEETIAQKRALAEDILAQLQAVEGEERQTLFDKLMNQYSEDGRDEDGNLSAPDGYTATPGKMVPEFEQASYALGFGEISGIVESSYGYHIILRSEVDDLESYADEYKEYQLDEQMSEWASSADVERSDLLDKLDVIDCYSRYTAWQAALAEAQESQHPQETQESQASQDTQG